MTNQIDFSQIAREELGVTVAAGESKTLSPEQLFLAAWMLVPMVYSDPSKLHRWPVWADYYKRRTQGNTEGLALRSDNEDTAIRCVNEMLASVPDWFTCAVPAGQKAQMLAPAAKLNVSTMRLPDGAGYLRIRSFMSTKTPRQVRRALKRLGNINGLVLDLRDNKGGRLNAALKCAQYMIHRGLIVTTEERIPAGGQRRRSFSASDNKLFVFTDESDDKGGFFQSHVVRSSRCMLTNKRIVCLVDSETASAAEVLCAALQNAGATVIGSSKTRGKGVAQNWFDLGDEQASMYLTNMRFFAPNGVWFGDAGQTVANGITPDRFVLRGPGHLFGTKDDHGLNAALEEVKKPATVNPFRAMDSFHQRWFGPGSDGLIRHQI
jgi:hypothetical protein